MKTALTVIYVDTEVRHVQEIEPDEPVKLELHGGGGTEFYPGFDYITEQGLEPKAIIYFTDGECDSYPEQEPDAPTLWIIFDNKHFNPPFGEVLHINS
jgi:predicted metal-dependent peptidase